MIPHFTSASCPTCDTLFTGLELDGDEDGDVYAVLELSSCPVCAALLCPSCAQFQCDGCDRAHCLTHLVEVPDGTEKPLRFCPSCAKESEIGEQLAFYACPECLSQELTATLYEAPKEAATGYDGSGWRYTCHACGATGPGEDLCRTPQPPRKTAASATAPAIQQIQTA